MCLGIRAHCATRIKQTRVRAEGRTLCHLWKNLQSVRSAFITARASLASIASQIADHPTAPNDRNMASGHRLGSSANERFRLFDEIVPIHVLLQAARNPGFPWRETC